MEKRTMLKTGFVVGIGLLAVLGVMAVRAAEGEMMMKEGKEAVMADMQQCMQKYMMMCEKNTQWLTEAAALFDAAIKDVDAQNTTDAKNKIQKAKSMLMEVQTAQKECMAKMPTCNAKCPISGKPIEMMSTPQELTRMYNGKKVGFCCPACPPQWDKLTNQEKQAKLKEAMPKMPEKEKMMKMVPEGMKMQKDRSAVM